MKKKQKSSSIKLTCPQCGGGMMAITTDIILRGHIKTVNKEGLFAFKYLSFSEGNLSHIECEKCGHVLKDHKGKKVSNLTELVNWLKKRDLN